MAFRPFTWARRRIRTARFRDTPAFAAQVDEAMAVADRQSFCSPTDYAQSRVRNSMAGAREVIVWRVVRERLLTAAAPVADPGKRGG